MQAKQQVIADARALQAQLRRLQVEASIDPKRCVPGGSQLAFYGLRLHGSTRAADIAKVLPELERAISQSRRRRTPLRFDDMLLRLEAEHPAKQPLHWTPRVLERTGSHCAALGVSHYDGERLVTVSLESVPHMLIAGETGSGKSVLLRNLITSLCYATSPDDLRIALIDLKNEDLLPYQRLPHVLSFAGNRESAVALIERIVAEKQARIDDPTRKPYRLLLIVDELAQLVPVKGAIDALGDLMSIGRGKLINVVACTQTPTEDGGMGAMMKANVPLRLIGAVSAGQSYVATRRKNAQADYLPGNGSFLYIAGPDMYRFQSFLLDEQDERRAVALIRKRWGQAAAVSIAEPVTLPEPEAVRDEIDDIAAQVAQMLAAGASKNAMARAVFGKPFAGSYATKINAAIERLSTTTAASTTASTTTTHTSESAVESSSSRSEDKIIKLRRIA